VRTLKLIVTYDGTDYVGWQRQSNGTSIQSLLEDALAPIEGGPVTVAGAGRTDAGVHALGQVASVPLTAVIDPATLARALNAVLPPDVRVLEAAEAAPDFHARFSAHAKTYRYQIREGPFVGPFERRYAWHQPQPLDNRAMAEAAAALIGRHDFASFQAAGSDVKTTERTIHALRVEVERPAQGDAARGRLIVVEVEADGFLRHMVRTIVGTLVEVGHGRRPVGEMASLLAAGDRSGAGPTAPARGLFLVRVAYEARSHSFVI
jgi:tRNA pseudouridine38-40 synthase